MDEYIKKNALYEIITQLEELARNRYLDAPSLYYPMYMTQLNERTHFKHIIQFFPTADVEPVRHGRCGMDGGKTVIQFALCVAKINSKI